MSENIFKNSKGIERVNYGAIAYHFMLHSFRAHYSSIFSQEYLEFFIYDFVENFSRVKGIIFVNEDGKPISHKEITQDIMYNYVQKEKDARGNPFLYFPADCIKILRDSYEESSQRYKTLVYEFEKMLIQESYRNPDIYLVYERAYEKDTKQYKNDKPLNLA